MDWLDHVMDLVLNSVRGPRTEHDNGRGPRTEQAGEVKDNEVGKYKPENSSGRDEKNKSIEGKEEMEWLDHSEPETCKFRQRLVALRLSGRYVFFGVDDNKSAASCAQG